MPGRMVSWLAMMVVACDEGGGEEQIPPAPACEGQAEVASWPDADGDGHGDAAAQSELSCEVPAGRSATGDDCDDADALVFPGAPELCDGRLNDCSDPAASEDGSIAVGDVAYTDLQQALNEAVGGDEVRICPGLYSGNFEANVAVSIVGVGGRELVTLDGGDSGTVLAVAPGSTVTGLTLTQGQAEVGGGLRLTEGGELVVADCTLVLNRAQRGGGLAVPPGSTVALPGTLLQVNTALEGGGIFAGQGSRLDLTDAHVDDNRADYGGGISGVELDIVGGLVTYNSAEDGTGSPHYLGGAGVLLEGDSVVSGTEIAFNTSAESGGGLSMGGGTLTLTDVQIHDNLGGYSGGGLELSEVIASLEGTTTIGPGNSCDGFGGGAYIDGGSLTGGEFHGNTGYEGGGLYGHQTELADLWVHHNHADVGGGIELRGGSISDAAIEDNTADWIGGLLTDASGYGAVSVQDTTVTRNVATGSDGGVGIDADDLPNTVYARVTITDNQATNGGGLAVRYGRARLIDSVVQRNVATDGEGGGLAIEYQGTLEITGTDLGEGADDNSPSDVSTSQGPDYHGYGASSTFDCNTNGCTPTP